MSDDEERTRRLRALISKMTPISKPDDKISLMVCIRVADAEVVAPRSRITKCSRCGAPVWIQDKTEELAPKARIVCLHCVEASVIS